ncbi:Zinc cluster transcription factor CZF1 [Spathaspora sp. JA1]|nr:Zinc cluster transcription factor CZF1 [Spathaspora sp. JA1]
MNTWQTSNWQDSSEPSNEVQQHASSGSDVNNQNSNESNTYTLNNAPHQNSTDPQYRSYSSYQPSGPVPGLGPVTHRGVYIANSNYLVQPNDADITKLQATSSVFHPFQPPPPGPPPPGPPQSFTYLPGEYMNPSQSGSNPPYPQQHPAMIPVPVGQYPVPEFNSYQGMNSSDQSLQQQQQQQGWDPYNSLPRIRPNQRQLSDSDKGSPSFKADKKVKKKPKPKKAASWSSFSTDSTTAPNTKPLSKRSRMGCLTCRHRKKRCCETRPRCMECTRLGLQCTWPKPGTEYKNKPKNAKEEENVIDHEIYGKIKVLRGIVEYKNK